MHCYLIDPLLHTVNPIDLDIEDIRQIHKAIGDHHFDTAYVRINGSAGWIGLTLFVDDEGAFDEENCTFSIDKAHLAGLAVVAGMPDDEGNTLAPACTLEELEASIEWHDHDMPVDTSFTIISF
jgi:hypothetical protein